MIGALAALIAFAGSATAAVVVTGKQIQDNSITTKDLRDGGLRGVDVRNESLTQSDFGTVVEGPQGPQGDRGPIGQPGSSGLVHVIEPMAIPKGATRTWGAHCPVGTRVISGGGSAASPGIVLLTESAPLDNAGSGWWVGIRNGNASTVTGYAWALCVKA
jgi:hypothetical protein